VAGGGARAGSVVSSGAEIAVAGGTSTFTTTAFAPALPDSGSLSPAVARPTRNAAAASPTATISATRSNRGEERSAITCTSRRARES
jgi:hypothetical protein